MRNKTCQLIFFFVILIFASLFSIIHSFKGFAGYDLSPMISANNLAIIGESQYRAIGNPMPPGFTFIVYLFTKYLGTKYSSYFYGNIIFCITLYTISIIQLYKVNVTSIQKLILNLQIISIICINLVTDGHFYVSDTSNIYCLFVLFLFELFILKQINLKEKKEKIESGIYPLIVLSSFVIYLKPNAALFTALIIISSTSYYLILNFKNARKLTALILILLLSTIYLEYIVLKKIGVIDFDTYLEIIRGVSKNRGVDLNNIRVELFKIKYNVGHFNFYAAYEWNKYILLTILSYILLLVVFFSNKNITLNKLIFGILFLAVSLIGAYLTSYFTFGLFVLLYLIYSLSLIKNGVIYNKYIIILYIIYWGSAFTGIFCMTTNYDVKSSDYPYLIFSVLGNLYLGTLIREKEIYTKINKNKLKNQILVLLVLLSLTLVHEGYTRIKILLAGPPAQASDFKSLIKDDFFDNLKTSLYHKETLSSIDEFFIDNHINNKNYNIFLKLFL